MEWMLAESLLFLPMVLYPLSNIPQLYKNYVMKSTQGLSLITLQMFYFGVLASFCYIYLLDLPLAYKVIIPIQSLLVLLYGIQAYRYESLEGIKKRIITSYFFITLLVLGCWIIGSYYPLIMGKTLAWIVTFIFTIYQIPQIIKIYKQQHVRGFSPYWSIIDGVSALFELGLGIFLNTPLPLRIHLLRKILFDFILISQFVYYEKTSLKKMN